MVTDQLLESERILLRMVTADDCSNDYIRWMNDMETNRYMETRWYVHDKETIRSFIEGMRNSDHSYLFAIINKKNCKHIGNIKLGPIHNKYHYADISFFIGEKELWGNGLTKEAVKLVCDYGFNSLNLHRIQAGVIDGNTASSRVLEASGFVCEGMLRDKFIVDGEYRDHLIYGLIKNQ